MADINQILHTAQQRIARIGAQEMEILDTQLEAMAAKTALGFERIEFTDKRLGILDSTASFGHGQEPSVFIPGQYNITVRGQGAPMRHFAECFGTLPEHSYPLHRVTTPNMLITPIMAARLFMNDTVVRKQFAEMRNAFMTQAAAVLSTAIEDIYGTLNIIPFDFLGTMTVMGNPMLHVWRNIVGDIVGYRWEVYVGYGVLPARAMATEEDGTPINADVTNIDNIGNAEAN